MLLWKWPFVTVRRKPAPSRFPPALVYIPDGRLGVIHHLKGERLLGVRPVDTRGNYYPNEATHWTEAQRWAIPHELSLHVDQLRPVVHLPEWAK
jgi:hypothetical protein